MKYLMKSKIFVENKNYIKIYENLKCPKCHGTGYLKNGDACERCEIIYSDICRYLEEIQPVKSKSKYYHQDFFIECLYQSIDEPNRLFFYFYDDIDDDNLENFDNFLKDQKIKYVKNEYVKGEYSHNNYLEIEVYIDDKKLKKLAKDAEIHNASKKYNI